MSSFSEIDDAIPTPRAPLPAAVCDFLNRMPTSYRSHFSESEARAHTEIVMRRDNAPVHLEQWIDAKRGAVWLCVVTDDRPGLLALLSAAITAHSLNVRDAQIYSRVGNAGQIEAVDFFRVESINNSGATPLTKTALDALLTTVQNAVAGAVDIATLRRHSCLTSRPPAQPEISVYFDGEVNGASRLLVETTDQSGLLTTLTTALYRAGVSIIWSHVATLGGIARDEFHVLGSDERALSEENKEGVIAQVLRALSRMGTEDSPSQIESAPVEKGRLEENPEEVDRLSQIQMTEPGPVLRGTPPG